MSESASRIIRLSWDEWLASRAAKRAALEAKGLSFPSRRSTVFTTLVFYVVDWLSDILGGGWSG